MPSRRTVLTSVPAPLTAGCLDNVETGPARIGDGTEASVPESKGPVRGEDDVELATESIAADDDVEYLPEDDGVRYVAARRSGEFEEGGTPEREPDYETVSFEKWAEIRCRDAAGSIAAEHANDELGTDEVGYAVTSSIEGTDHAGILTVQTVLDRDGDVIATTDVAFEDLVGRTPASVTATYVLEGREHTLEVPIFAEHRVSR